MKRSLPHARWVTGLIAALVVILVGGRVALASWTAITINSGSFQTTTLGAPTGLTATQSGRGFDLAWAPATGAAAGLTQNVQEGVDGAAVATISSVSGTTATYSRTGLLGDTKYCYDVQTAYDNWLATGPPTCPAAFAPTYAVNASGGASGWYAASSGFNNHCVTGTTTTTAINTSQVVNPAPQAVYQTAITAPNNHSPQECIWTYTGLTPNATYQIRLQFAELQCTTAGCRDMSVFIQGTQVLNNFDIFATAGGEYIAITRTFTFTADATGAVNVGFAAGKQPAIINGIEIL